MHEFRRLIPIFLLFFISKERGKKKDITLELSFFLSAETFPPFVSSLYTIPTVCTRNFKQGEPSPRLSAHNPVHACAKILTTPCIRHELHFLSPPRANPLCSASPSVHARA